MNTLKKQIGNKKVDTIKILKNGKIIFYPLVNKDFSYYIELLKNNNIHVKSINNYLYFIDFNNKLVYSIIDKNNYINFYNKELNLIIDINKNRFYDYNYCKIELFPYMKCIGKKLINSIV